MLNKLNKLINKNSKSSCSYFYDLPEYTPNYHSSIYAREGYARNPIVYKCIRLIADSIHNIKLDYYNHNNQLIDNPSQQSKLYKLFNRPNNLQDKVSLLDEIIVQDRLYGNVYLLLVLENNSNNINSLYCLDSTAVRQESGAYYFDTHDKTIKFPINKLTGKAKNKNQILIHLKTYNPLNNTKGLSPLESIAGIIDLYNYGINWNISLLKNSAKPSGLLKTNNSLLDEQYLRLKEQFRLFFQGTNNAGNIPVLENGLEFQAMGLSPQDMDFLNILKFAQKTIANIYNIPLALVTDDSSTYNNIQESKKALYYDAVIPIYSRVINTLNHTLSEYTQGEKLELNLDSIQVLAQDRQKIFDNIIKAVNNNILSIDEARQELGY